METILMDNGLFAEENNILPQLFPDEKRKKMASLFMLLYSEAHKDTELVQGVKKTDLSKVDIGTKTCLLFNDVVRYMSQFENRESIYSQLFQQFENTTFESLLYSLPENNRQYDFEQYWKELMESGVEPGETDHRSPEPDRGGIIFHDHVREEQEHYKESKAQDGARPLFCLESHLLLIPFVSRIRSCFSSLSFFERETL